MVFQLEDDIVLFPKPSLADEDGLLAVGGDLRIERLLEAYALGIFPWYSEDSPILWYAPHERFVLFPNDIRISKSMKKVISRNEFTITFNKAFEEVITNCSSISRKNQDGTWIIDDMKRAYLSLHHHGFANSVEVWRDGQLVGGLYGVLVGKTFCGESMFSKVPNASKAALIYLTHYFDLDLIDCQIYSQHLESMGAKLIPQIEFSRILDSQVIEQYGFQTLLRTHR